MAKFRVMYTIRDFKDIDAEDSSTAAENVRVEVMENFGPLRPGAVTINSVSEAPEED